MKDLKNKVAVVTGGASGIGKGLAKEMIARGMKVVIADIEEKALAATAEEIGAVGIRTDVTDLASVQALANATIERFGKVHVLCNNAGIGPMAMIADMTIDDWRWMINVNLWGVIHGVHTFLPLLRAHGEESHIVNTASIGGLATIPTLGGYAATKSGVVALSEALSKEMALTNPNIGVTVFCPGPIRSNLGHSRRNRPANLDSGKLADVQLEETPLAATLRWLEPADGGRIILKAITDNELYAFTHPEMFEREIGARFDAIRAAHGRWTADAFAHR